MGRRALPKLDPTLDLAKNFRLLEEMTLPVDPAALFGRDAPLEVEMGSGKGLFLASAAAANPAHNFLGIEVAGKYARHAASRLTKRGLTNAIAISGDGLKLFAEGIRTASVAAVHVYFPDPWWKARHKKRRVMRESFAYDIERVLVPGGRLHFWSDVKEYFDVTMELLAAHTKLRGPIAVPERDPEHDLDYRTHFERRKRLLELPIYRAEFERTAD